MRLELDKPVLCEDEEVGKLADLVVDPVAKRVTHLVVKPEHGAAASHLVPIELVEPTEQVGGIALTCSRAELEALPPVEEFTYLRLGEVTVPIGALESVASDVVTLKLSKDEVGDLPSHKVHRW